MNLKRQNIGSLLLFSLLAWHAQTDHGAVLAWPAGQYLPTLSKPAATIDCISMDSIGTAQQALFTSLAGIVNQAQPRIACVTTTQEGEFTWLNIHHLSHDMVNGFAAIQKYETNVTGLVVPDPNQPDTLNLATTIAGLKDELICFPSLLATLTNAPYNLPIKDDLRGEFLNKYQVYECLYSNYWPQCTHRVIVGLETNCYWHLRDYAIALKAAVVWLDPSIPADANVLKLYTSQMTPVGGIYLGWVPNENADLNWLATYGIPVMASDFFDNASVYGGVRTLINIPPIPPISPLQNKVYVSITLSDGDNVQYMQHLMEEYWQSPARGSVPLGWTVQPLLADFDPGMLNYYWSTATTNDCLLAGPSGAGYAHIEHWIGANVAAFTKSSNPYLQQTGIRTITVWDTVSSATGAAYATNCPTLVGINDGDDGYYETHDGTLPVLGFPSEGHYATNSAELLYAITNTAKYWTPSSRMFIPVQARSWTVTPADCLKVANELNPDKYVVVRPDQLFLLYQESAGLDKGGAVPYVATQPVSQFVSVGTNITFNVVASGTGPLSYQWQFNGNSIANATNNTYSISNVLTSEEGNYQAVITNRYGSVTSTVCSLTIYGPEGGTNTIYHDTFSRSEQLNGSPPFPVDTDGATWWGWDQLKTDGSELTLTNANPVNNQMFANAFLPFTPQVGHIYTLSADIRPTGVNGQWLAFGFAANALTNAYFAADTVGVDWMLVRGNDTQYQLFAGPGTTGLIQYSGGNNWPGSNDTNNFETFSVVLDTTSGNSSGGWSIGFYTNGVEMASTNYASNPSIQYVGLGADGTIGYFKNFILNDAVLPIISPQLSVQAFGRQINLAWPSRYLGWTLQSNSAGLQDSNAWTTVPGSTATNRISVSIDQIKSDVFFRLSAPTL